jgi:hypothetical protein
MIACVNWKLLGRFIATYEQKQFVNALVDGTLRASICVARSRWAAVEPCMRSTSASMKGACTDRGKESVSVRKVSEGDRI